jgi:type I site-specific restriction endonuclease
LDEAGRIAVLDESADAWPQLNKIAFWMATGSGKTLLMHAHILQYRRFLETHGRGRELNRIILLTPNEGLSQQHLREFEKAGIEAEIFNKEGRGLFAGQAVEILEVTKLKEEMGEKTVAVEAFEGNNLVLVDEGHRGASAGGEGAWMKLRNALCDEASHSVLRHFRSSREGARLSPISTRAVRSSTLVSLVLRRRVQEGLPNPQPRG